MQHSEVITKLTEKPDFFFKAYFNLPRKLDGTRNIGNIIVSKRSYADLRTRSEWPYPNTKVKWKCCSKSQDSTTHFNLWGKQLSGIYFLIYGESRSFRMPKLSCYRFQYNLNEVFLVMWILEIKM